jgi:hypothetical protein
LPAGPGLCCAVIGTVFSVLPPSAFAQNPHFQRASAVCSGPNLLTRFTIVGLGETESVDVVADADAEVSCVNRGENIPPGLTQDVRPKARSRLTRMDGPTVF